MQENHSLRRIAHTVLPVSLLFTVSGVLAAPSHPSHSSQSPSAPARAVPRGYRRGEALARTALSYRGMPYRWGGDTTRGFDCSGFVKAVYRKWGIYLPHCAAEQIHSGERIPRSKLQPGDLVFFKNTYRHGPSHVGIYVGNGWFIHAADPAQGVILSRLDSAFNKKHWCEARRLHIEAPTPKELKAEQHRVVITVEEEGHDQKVVLPGVAARKKQTTK